MKNINSPDFKFVVVGGGTAGWLTALYMRAYFPHSSITVVESSTIGILGAGEGTTAHFRAALNFLNISLTDFIRETHATIKNGIQFTNWHGDGRTYFHPFAANPEFSYFNFNHVDDILTNRPSNALVFERISRGETLDNICVSARSSAEGRVVFAPGSNWGPSRLDQFRQVGAIALHFNANLVAEFFKRIGTEQRGIQLVDAKLTHGTTDEQGNLTHLHAPELSIPCDFVFDCSGFHRLFIEKHFHAPWVSYQSQLPVNRALPFFLPETEVIPPYTESIALRNGWMWKIPVRGRYGCGYVFDKRRCSDDEALNEVQAYVGAPVESPRTFAFEPGSFETTWHHNCVALGLSAGFLEPLEATSIMVTVQSLQHFYRHLNGVLFNDAQARHEYNQTISKINSDIRDFLYFHYLTERRDSDFWIHFRRDNVCDSALTDKFADFHHLCQLDKIFQDNVFSKASYFAVGAGLRWLDSHAAKRHFQRLTQGAFGPPYHRVKQQYLEHLNMHIPLMVSHRFFLNYLLS